MAIKALKVFLSHIQNNKILSNYWKQDWRDSFDKIFDLALWWLYPYVRKLANNLKRKWLLPSHLSEWYKNYLEFYIKLSITMVSILTLWIILNYVLTVTIK